MKERRQGASAFSTGYMGFRWFMQARYLKIPFQKGVHSAIESNIPMFVQW
ncbi:unnamed protein product [marine sediment metagenome]|uniref:Uncharacterized protein n=1 Tax=marine sediment metagenome TaxID=412755 RepID=X1S828_9ZZZZ